MSDYTTKTASIKATAIDTRKIDAKQIDTEKLFINGTQFDPSQIKESPNEAMFSMIIEPYFTDLKGYYNLVSLKSDQNGENIFGTYGYLQKGSESEGLLPNGIYAVIYLDENFIKCICGNYSDLSFEKFMFMIFMIPTAKFTLVGNFQNDFKPEQCILENFLKYDTNEEIIWVIKICEEDDNLFELYGGITEENSYFSFVITIPYYIPENDTSSSTYSLRKTNPIDSIREKFEQMRQKNLDNPTE